MALQIWSPVIPTAEEKIPNLFSSSVSNLQCETCEYVSDPNRKGVYTRHPIANHVLYDPLSPSFRVFSFLSFIYILCSVEQALSQPKWQEAMDEEMKALEKNCTWDVVDLSRDEDPMGMQMGLLYEA